MTKDRALKIFSEWWSGDDNVRSIPDTLSYITQRFQDNNPFYFIRVSDADKHIIKGGPNVWKRYKYHLEWHEARGLLPPPFEKTSPELRQELMDLILLGELDPEIIDLVYYDSRKIDKELLPCWNFNCFVYGFTRPLTFIPFLKKTFKNTLFIGSENLSLSPTVKNMFNVKTFYDLPNPGYFSLIDEYEKIRELAKQHKQVLAAVGFSSKIIGKRLYEDGVNVKFLDIGSVADPMVGNFNRRWSKKILMNWYPLSGNQMLEIYDAEFGQSK